MCLAVDTQDIYVVGFGCCASSSCTCVVRWAKIFEAYDLLRVSLTRQSGRIGRIESFCKICRRDFAAWTMAVRNWEDCTAGCYYLYTSSGFTEVLFQARLYCLSSESVLTVGCEMGVSLYIIISKLRHLLQVIVLTEIFLLFISQTLCGALCHAHTLQLKRRGSHDDELTRATVSRCRALVPA